MRSLRQSGAGANGYHAGPMSPLPAADPELTARTRARAEVLLRRHDERGVDLPSR